MFAVFTVLLILAISLVVVRVATVGLTLTGLSKDLAEFQALSAFTRSGFTTRESEEIVNHPVRRRIIMILMLSGNAGIVIAITSMLQAFTQVEANAEWYNSTWFRFTVLTTGVVLLWAVATSKIVERGMWSLNSWAVRRWTHIDVMDYMGLLRVTRDYAVCELQVHPGDWVADKTLIDLQLPREGVIILGIEREDGHYIGAPRGTSKIEPGDTLLLYGRQETLQDLDTRRDDIEGNMQHVIAVTRQIDILDEEIAEDPVEEEEHENE
jgi:hypothetical protein